MSGMNGCVGSGAEAGGVASGIFAGSPEHAAGKSAGALLPNKPSRSASPSASTSPPSYSFGFFCGLKISVGGRGRPSAVRKACRASWSRPLTSRVKTRERREGSSGRSLMSVGGPSYTGP
eukprot:6579603-Heterocapsa_arctica.AAC.1